MNFYKIENGLPIHGSGDAIPEGFAPYTVGQEPQELLDAMKVESGAQVAQQLKAQAQAYLDKTDHKTYSDYTPKAGEDLTVIKTIRANARSFLRGEVSTWSAE